MSGSTVDVIIGNHAYQPSGRFKSVVQRRPYYDTLAGVKPPDDLVADPFNGSKDWTGVVTDECYGPCAENEILSLASVDFSPTTLSYLEERRPSIYELIKESYWVSKINFSTHASALMQGGYDHLIFPFESLEVKDTQVSWAKEGFRTHFGEYPKGAWAPEAGIDMPTLELFNSHGINFTVLAPWQAEGIKKIGSDHWEYVGGAIDPSRPYKCCLDNGKEIAIFFFDNPLAEKVAHNKCGIYDSSENFINHIKMTRQSGLTVTYNDLETWGHHHKGEVPKTVSSALLDLYEGKVKDGSTYKLTTFSKHLKEHPPEYEVKIRPWTSWSCKTDKTDHALGRWGDHIRTDCNCGDVWDSRWRSALRTAHEYLNREIENIYFREIGPKYFKDPGQTLKDYVLILLERNNLGEFLKAHAKRGISKNHFEIMYNLLELQKFSMLMNTSCGWFHNSIRRIEPVMNMVSANSALEILKEILPNGRGQVIEKQFMQLMSQVNIENGGDNVFKEAIAANPYYKGKPGSNSAA
ncbi:MAG: DUF3536 domain-containing protein [Candidatus Melainabacteria bacterium]|nr:DUF3536 domain-containing protein [Candidatus Melainabacteria bacterium]